MSTRQSILSLPISSRAPIYHLTPDPLFPTPSSLLALSSYTPSDKVGLNGPVQLKEGDAVPPSMLRRSRMVRGGGAFSYTSPLPLEFPYDIQEKDETPQEKRVGDETKARAETIETALARLEISPQVAVGAGRTAFSSEARQGERFPKAALLSLSRKCRDEWLPNLDLGEEGSEEREVLVGVLSGRTVLAREGDGKSKETVEKLGFSPWSLCYGGHQFGSWAGQLGDGRAISIRKSAPPLCSRNGNT
jgi:hypothetical protein